MEAVDLWGRAKTTAGPPAPGPHPVVSASCPDVKEVCEGQFRSVPPPTAPRYARRDTVFGPAAREEISLPGATSAFKNGETHLRGRSLMIPEPHRAISSTYTPSRNASTARPGKHRVGRAVTPPRAAVFEWIKRRKRRFFAEAPTW